MRSRAVPGLGSVARAASGRHDANPSALSRWRHRVRSASQFFEPQKVPGPRDPLHESSRRGHLRLRAVCLVANARRSYGYCCACRLAVHPDQQRPVTARFVQRIPSTPRQACPLTSTTASGASRTGRILASNFTFRTISAAKGSSFPSETPGKWLKPPLSAAWVLS